MQIIIFITHVIIQHIQITTEKLPQAYVVRGPAAEQLLPEIVTMVK